MSAHGRDVILAAAPDEPPPQEWGSCSLCGVRSPLKAAFRVRKRGRSLCPACQEDEQLRSQRGMLLGLAFWMALGVGATLLGGNGNAGWVFINLVLLNIMQWLTIIPHELGHALAARAMGLRVWHIIIGAGRRLVSWRAAGVRFDVHALPLGGLTVTEVRDQRWARLRRMCVLAAGPLVNLLMMWAAIEFGRDAWLAERLADGPAPVFMFIAANALVLVVNLWPRHTRGGPSDGAQLVRLPFLRRADFRAAQHYTTLYRIELAAMHGEAAQAIIDARAALLEYPDDLELKVALSAALLNGGCFSEGRELLQELVQDPALRLEIKPVLYNNLACANINLDDPALGEQSLSMATLAHRWMPWAAWARVNLGCAEAVYGDAQRAAELLRDPRLIARAPEVKVEAMSGLALAYARLAQTSLSEAALAEARAADPRSHFLAVMERHLQAQLQRTAAVPQPALAGS